MHETSDNDPINRAEEFLQVFRKGAEFTRELLKENERLRYQALKLERERSVAPPVSLDAQLVPLKRRIEQLEQEKEDILEQVRAIEEENINFANRYVEVEAENNMLANLYIASYQLHSTLNFEDVVRVISDIIINLIGGEDFALYLLDEKVGTLEPIAAEGVPLKALPRVLQGQGIVGQACHKGENYVADVLLGPSDPDRPLVVIPMMIKERMIGAIVVYSLLVQKKAFTTVDYELFSLLGAHAATAAFAAKLYTLSERKLTTMQGLIDLLTR